MTILIVAFSFIVLLAVLDLWIGVTNDAVNFINSAVGSRIATRRTILFVASIGVVFGALFSSGMMEVARKGVFDVSRFYESGELNITAIMCVYLGVMAADVIMLDLFNTFGLPTSTTVSIVSELVGASIGVMFWMQGGDLSSALSIINTGPVLGIYSGIFMSVIIAFLSAAIIMFLLRLLYTHDLERTFPRVGWLWTGLCFSSLLYFVLFKGLKSATFLDEQTKTFIQGHVWTIMGVVFVISAVLTIIFSHRYRLIFKVIILSSTCSLAMAFAGNDLVNFIGPTVAAGQAVFVEGVDLSGKVPTPNWALLLAGAIMVSALWSSKKAKAVTDTEVRLAAAGNMKQRFKTTMFARAVVRASHAFFHTAKALAPASLRQKVRSRTDPMVLMMEGAPPYDLLRASVNLTLASILISIGTALKLPLSTTYISFMVAMGASLADRTWDRESADGRVTGMLAVIGGWLVTGFLASLGAFIMASILYLLSLTWGLALVAVLVVVMLIKSGSSHDKLFANHENVVDQIDDRRS
ncbi:MAG: inorganic phosphate transporter [Acidobacteriota bacterium]|nr:inorganic phosphate transporter [Acidobacteriota bacterium]